MYLKKIKNRTRSWWNKNKCIYKNIYDCPFSSDKECPNLKSNCFHKKRNKRKRECQGRNLIKLTLFSLCGIGLIFGGLLINYGAFEGKNFDIILKPSIIDLLKGVGVSIVASCLVSLIIDIPSKILDFKNLIIETYTSNDYLNALSEGQLKKLRMDITNKLHRKNVPNMPRGLIELDQQICDLLNKPYYKLYREDIKCKFETLPQTTDKTGKDEESKFIKKTFDIEYVMHNPYGKEHSVFGDLGFSKQIVLSEGKELKDYFYIEEFSLSIDQKPFMDIRNCISILYSKTPTLSEYYNTITHIVPKDNRRMTIDSIKTMISNGGQKGYDIKKLDELKQNNPDFPSEPKLFVEFNNKLHVKLRYVTYVPMYDTHYTKRLRYPVKYYRLDYSCDEENVEVYGQLISTLLDQSKISTKYSEDGKQISLESYDWLLPKNGVYTVISKKNRECAK